MTKARYQPILKDQIPTVTLPFVKKNEGNVSTSDDDGSDRVDDNDGPQTAQQQLGIVRLIAGGTVFGDTIKGAAKTFSPGRSPRFVVVLDLQSEACLMQ
jgi:hypothetical protein